jgi:glycerol-1-phosphate dehydrogenase [NAD(P)+]
MKTLSIKLTSFLAPYMHRLNPGAVMISSDALARAAGALERALPKGHWLIVADPVTRVVAGDRVAQDVAAAGLARTVIILDPPGPGQTLVADEASVDKLVAIIRGAVPPVTAVVAVGAGTINDIVKHATYKTGIPYGVVATAPSMNGYTSPIAAILSGGVKTVQPAQTPVAVIADTGVLAAAPARMIAAGFGDLLSKPVSNADWLMSHLLTGSKYCPDVMRLVEEGSRLLDGLAGKLALRDPEAVARLTAALILSGYAMALAGTSAPASGGEHLISHYLDMTHYAQGAPNDLHGCQVGVATVVAAALYESLLAWDPSGLNIPQRVAAWVPWSAHEARLRQEFGSLADAVIPHARESYPGPELLEERLDRIQREGPALLARLRPGMRSPAAILSDLKAARCPVTFSDIGCSPERAWSALRLGKEIRPRYTILHLCGELGTLEAWGRPAMKKVF